TTLLYVSPVQIIPSWYHTGTPRHFHSSTTSGSACLINFLMWASISPRQSPSSLILASISFEGESVMVVVAFPVFVVRGWLSRSGGRARGHESPPAPRPASPSRRRG